MPQYRPFVEPDARALMLLDRIDRALGQLLTTVNDRDYPDDADRDADQRVILEAGRIANRLLGPQQ